jgi:hypothetical protein
MFGTFFLISDGLYPVSRAFLVVPNKNLDGRTHVAFYVARFMAVLIVMTLGAPGFFFGFGHF